MKEIIDSIRVNLFERITSPLFGAFALSWCGWNYRFFLVAFGDMNTLQKLTYTQAVLYPDWHTTLGHCVVYPFLSAAVFIAAYPLPARWCFAYWHGMQLRQKELRDKMEKATLLTAEESHTLRHSLLEQKWKFEKHIQEQAARIESLESLLNQERNSYQSAVADLAREQGRLSELEAKEKEILKVSHQKDALLKSVREELDVAKTMHQKERFEREKELEELIELRRRQFKKVARYDSDLATTILSIILKNGRTVRKQTLRLTLTQDLKLSEDAVDSAILETVGRGFILEAGESYMLTPRGEQYAEHIP